MAKNNNFILCLCAVAVAAVFTGACARPGSGERAVCVSIEPQRWIAEQIAGDRIKVESLMPGDANPENFDPPMSALRNASSAAAYLQIGHLPWEEALIERVRESNPDIKVVDTSAGIELITGTHSHDGHSHDIDPHTWSSVKNARIIAANTLAVLKSADPQNAGYYAANYTSLCERLDSLDSAFAKALAPAQGQSFMVWHPSLSYFARDYGLNQIALGSENKESTVKAMQHQIDEALSHNARVFFVQPSMDGDKSEEIINLTGARKVVIHPLDYDWWGEMKAVCNSLTNE